MNSVSNKPLQLLIVDDSSSAVHLMCAMLEDTSLINLEIESAKTLANAFDLLDSNEIDIIILDLNLPDSIGLDTLIKVKKKYPYIPIIIITGEYTEEVGIKSIAMGAQDYLIKGKFDSYLLEKSITYSIEHIKTEEALLYSESIWRSLVENSPDIIMNVDRDGIIQFSNRAAAETSADIPADYLAIGKRIYDNLPPEYQDMVKKSLERVFRTGKPDKYEVAVIGIHGTQLWYENRLSPVKEEEEIVSATIITTNITERKEAEEKLKFLSSFVEQSSECMALTGLDGNLLFINPAWAKIHGFGSSKELIGQHLNIFHNQCQLEKDVIPFNQKVIEKGFNTGEVGHIRRDGTPFPTQMITTALRNDQGKIIAIASIAKDITEQKKTEEKLRKASIVLNTMIDGVIIIDMKGVITDINKATTNQLGYTRDEVIGKSKAGLLLIEKERPKFFKEMIKLFSGEPIDTSEYRYKNKDGTEFPVSLNLSAIKDADGKPKGIVAVYRDISRLKEAEKKRINLEKELQHIKKLESVWTLAAGIAHEINTPMQYISDNTLFFSEGVIKLFELINTFQNLLFECVHNNKTTNILAKIYEAEQEADLQYLRDEIPAAIAQSLEGIDRVKKIVNAMKDFSRKDGDSKTKADINKAIESTIMVSRNEWKYVAEIEQDLDPELPLVSCFLGEINQVIMNLIVNAAQAIAEVVGDRSKSKGLITITSRSNGNSIIITVSDTGAGIPKDIHDRIFDQFFTTKDVGKGTGQGLSIAQNVIVNRHRGNISVDSEIGKGTTFTISLPVNS